MPTAPWSYTPLALKSHPIRDRLGGGWSLGTVVPLPTGATLKQPPFDSHYCLLNWLVEDGRLGLPSFGGCWDLGSAPPDAGNPVFPCEGSAGVPIKPVSLSLLSLPYVCGLVAMTATRVNVSFSQVLLGLICSNGQGSVTIRLSQGHWGHLFIF